MSICDYAINAQYFVHWILTQPFMFRNQYNQWQSLNFESFSLCESVRIRRIHKRYGAMHNDFSSSIPQFTYHNPLNIFLHADIRSIIR